MSHYNGHQILPKFACAGQNVASQGPLSFSPASIIPPICLEIPSWYKKLGGYARPANFLVWSHYNVFGTFLTKPQVLPCNGLVLVSWFVFLAWGSIGNYFKSLRST